MSWFKKPKQKLSSEQKKELPEDVWDKCDECGEILYSRRLTENRYVCPECDHHFRIPAAEHLRNLTDDGLEEEFDLELRSADPLEFEDSKPYPQRVRQAEEDVGPGDAVRTGRGRIDGRPAHVGAMDFRFIGGSMGSVVGEKVRRLATRAKTAAALEQLDEAGLPYVSILTHPTTGGVTASFAMLGDVILAEPEALIGFAGPRVIKQTIGQDLPEGFQRSEFLLEHGMIDRIVRRPEMKETVSLLLHHMT
ncbi:MAG: acetyl-CoA carboxylase carboxyltransferase subunit beta [Gemmatimonadota bacterium]